MSCLCKNQLAALATKLQNLPVAALAQLLNARLGPLSVVASLGPRVCGALSASAMASASAAASASASASATANANLALAASMAAKLEALAAVHRSLSLGALSPSIVANLRATISSSNLQLPTVLDALNAFLKPLEAALDKLHAAISSLQNIQTMTGLNLALPGVAFRLPTAGLSASARAALNARASASASLAASASAKASASLSASAMLAMRLHAATMALGFPLPVKPAALNAALNLTAGLPAFNVSPTALSSVAAKIEAILQAALALGVNMLSPSAATQLQAALLNAQANLTATVSGTATATASVQASTAMAVAAKAAASLNANAVLSAASSLNLSLVPNLQPLAVALSLVANLKVLGGTSLMASSPCKGCPIKF